MHISSSQVLRDHDDKLRILMAQYDTKLHLFDRCEVALAGHELPWLAALTLQAGGRSSLLRSAASTRVVVSAPRE